jgi:hypothetical protein
VAARIFLLLLRCACAANSDKRVGSGRDRHDPGRAACTDMACACG